MPSFGAKKNPYIPSASWGESFVAEGGRFRREGFRLVFHVKNFGKEKLGWNFSPQLSHEHKGPWLVGLYKGWTTTQVYWEYNKPWHKDPY